MKIAETDNIKAIYRSGEGNALFVSFSFVNFPHTNNLIPGQKFIEALNLPAIGIVAKGNNWFPLSEMIEIEEKIRGKLRSYDRRILYGFSMGGFGAIKYSALLGADAAISMSPQYSINPDHAPWDTRYRAWSGELTAGMEISANDCAGQIFVIYDDTLKLDRLHVDAIANLHPIDRLKLNRCGHETVKIVAGTEIMRHVIAFAEAGDGKAMAHYINGLKKQSLHYRTGLMIGLSRHHLARRRTEKAIATAKRTLEIDASNTEAAALLCHIYLLANDLPMAEAYASQAVENGGKHWHMAELASILHKRGRTHEALEIIAGGLAKAPHSAALIKVREAILRPSPTCP